MLRQARINPLRAGLVKDFDHLGRYRFSGHSVILERNNHSMPPFHSLHKPVPILAG